MRNFSPSESTASDGNIRNIGPHRFALGKLNAKDLDVVNVVRVWGIRDQIYGNTEMKIGAAAYFNANKRRRALSSSHIYTTKGVPVWHARELPAIIQQEWHLS